MKRGFTLVEIILYIGTLTILLTSLSIFLVYLLDARVKFTTITEVEQQGYFVLAQITQTVRNAEGINSPALGSSGSTLSVDVIDAIDDPTIFNPSGALIQVTKGTSSSVDLLSDNIEISGLTFTRVGNGIGKGAIKINFTLTHINSDDRNIFEYEKDFQTTVSLR